MSRLRPRCQDAAPSLVISNRTTRTRWAKIIKDFSLTLPPGSRCLLSGANGAGKTTLLQVLAGKTMVPTEDVRVIGRPPFHDTELTCSGDLAYLGAQWRRNVGSAGSVPLAGDISAGKMIFGVEGIDKNRRADLIDILDIDVDWNMMRSAAAKGSGCRWHGPPQAFQGVAVRRDHR